MRGAIEREGGIESRQFSVDILTLVAVALGQVFGFKRGLEGFGFGPVLVDLLVSFFFAYLLRGFWLKNVGPTSNNCSRLSWETGFVFEL